MKKDIGKDCISWRHILERKIFFIKWWWWLWPIQNSSGTFSMDSHLISFIIYTQTNINSAWDGWLVGKVCVCHTPPLHITKATTMATCEENVFVFFFGKKHKRQYLNNALAMMIVLNGWLPIYLDIPHLEILFSTRFALSRYPKK